MPYKRCAECANPALHKGLCQPHLQQRDRDRRDNKRVYNTKRWQMLRRQKLTLSPICERCDGELATQVHHVKDIRDGGAPYELVNLEALCATCHSSHTRAVQAANVRENTYGPGWPD